MIRIAILGSTGSIGKSALKVIERHPERFRVVGLAANRSAEALARQVARHRPRVAVLADEPAMSAGAAHFDDGVCQGGRDALLALAEAPDVDVVINALVGAAGLEPTLRALENGKRVALANKESLVAGGSLVPEAAERGGGELIPIDSEHSAILQCIEGYSRESISKVVLTASGGPFRGWSKRELQEVRPEQALRHPTWEMGAKITVDSATLANKALEVIEAHVLYGISYDRIEVVVHPQSIVHSLVEFVDGSVLAQVGEPTMELPILYALSYPERVADTSLRTFDLIGASPLTFETVDAECFPLFALGVGAGRAGGAGAAAFNAANEIAVNAFLAEEIRFHEMAEVVSAVLGRVGAEPLRDIDDVLRADRAARDAARDAIEQLQHSRVKLHP
jgi:1-deoxy-D-xylulose-5-phosphate reductoisomerase